MRILALLFAAALLAPAQDVVEEPSRPFDAWLTDLIADARSRGFSKRHCSTTRLRACSRFRASSSATARRPSSRSRSIGTSARASRRASSAWGGNMPHRSGRCCAGSRQPTACRRRSCWRSGGSNRTTENSPAPRPYSRRWPRLRGSRAARTFSAASCSRR